MQSCRWISCEKEVGRRPPEPARPPGGQTTLVAYVFSDLRSQLRATACRETTRSLFAYRPLLIAAACRWRLLGGNRRRNKVSRIDGSNNVRLNERVVRRTRRHRLNALAQHWRRCDRRIHDFLGGRGVCVDCRLNDALGPLAWNFLAHRLLDIFGISTNRVTGG